jgi:hypothetical protein
MRNCYYPSSAQVHKVMSFISVFPGRRYCVMLRARCVFTIYIQNVSNRQSVASNEVAFVSQIDYSWLKLETKLRVFSPQANCTYRATAACQRSKCELLRIGVALSEQRIPTAVNLNFLDPESLLYHSSSSVVILTRIRGHRSGPTTSQKNLVSSGIEPGISRAVARNSDY